MIFAKENGKLQMKGLGETQARLAVPSFFPFSLHDKYFPKED